MKLYISIKKYINRFSAGFTLVEMLVTVSLLVIFTTAAVSYNRNTSSQIALFREQGKLINAIYKVRSLSISTYNRTGNLTSVPCGYGIHFATEDKLIIFKDLPDAEGKCNVYGDNNSSFKFDYSGEDFVGSDEFVEEVDLKDVKIRNFTFDSGEDPTLPVLDGVDIIFVPPDPRVYINNSTISSFFDTPITIELTPKSVSLDSKLSVKISKYGQITSD